ncbi:unnamed protein product [Dicrocoelium dendriticum]|nr:unnamed protein product [Dicrocoelium dendriticum]
MTVAVCIILDVGIHMREVIDQGLDCLKSLIQRKFFAEKKEKVALILCGTAESDNRLSNGIEIFPNISLVRELSDIDWDLLEFINSETLLSTEQADVTDALIVGVDHLLNKSKAIKRLSEKRVLLVSNLEGPGDHSKLARLFDELRTADIQFSLIGRNLREDAFPGTRPSFATPHPNHSSVPLATVGPSLHKPAFKAICDLWHQLEGESYTFAEALPALAHFETRGVAQRGWRVDLCIGDSLALPVEGHIQVKEARPPPLNSLYAADPSAPICASTNYVTKDENPTQLDSSHVIRGYRYGDTVVPFSNADTAAVKLSSEKCLSVIGFTGSHNVPRNLYVGDSVIVFVSSDSSEDSPATLGLSALTQALIELDEVALVRRVYNRTSAPRLGVLTPEIQGTQVSLVYTDLAFAEDFRAFQFADLPITTESDVLSPSSLDIMETFVNSMLLGTELSDDSIEKECSEENGASMNDGLDIKPERLPNPWIQRLFSWFRTRGLCNSQNCQFEASTNSTNRWLDPRAFPGLEPLLTRLDSAEVDTALVEAREGLISSLPALLTTRSESTEEPVSLVAKRRRLMLSQLFGLSSEASNPQMATTSKPEFIPDEPVSITDYRTAGYFNSSYPKPERFDNDYNSAKDDMRPNGDVFQKQLGTAASSSDPLDAERCKPVISRLDFQKQLDVEDLIHDLE